jgi:hypothetical protein
MGYWAMGRILGGWVDRSRSRSEVASPIELPNVSGVFVTNTATTDADGKATIAIKANTKSGAFTAKGGVTGITGTADFALTNLEAAKIPSTNPGTNPSTNPIDRINKNDR